MGVADTYGNTQLKVGDPTGESFKLGNKVPIPDGIYVGYEGIVVVVGGRFTAEFEAIRTKWNDEIDLAPTLEGFNPVAQAANEAVAQIEALRRRKRRAIINTLWVVALALAIWLAIAWLH